MFKTNLNPTQKHVADIESWLIVEWKTTKKGFYSNWEMIPKAFNENRLSIITDNDQAIGFVVYRIHEFHADIDITEIKPSARKKGIARILIKETLDHFRQKGVLVTKLYCSPEDSEPFWKSIGFENFPKLRSNNKINMFKPLIKTIQPKEKGETNNTISLWDCDLNRASRMNAKWIWDLNFLSDNLTLVKPIIFPTSDDWTLELVRNGNTILMDKVKYFSVDLVDYPYFMIIRNVNV